LRRRGASVPTSSLPTPPPYTPSKRSGTHTHTHARGLILAYMRGDTRWFVHMCVLILGGVCELRYIPTVVLQDRPDTTAAHSEEGQGAGESASGGGGGVALGGAEGAGGEGGGSSSSGESGVGAPATAPTAATAPIAAQQRSEDTHVLGQAGAEVGAAAGGGSGGGGGGVERVSVLAGELGVVGRILKANDVSDVARGMRVCVALRLCPDRTSVALRLSSCPEAMLIASGRLVSAYLEI
jgi:hypothetical protein